MTCWEALCLHGLVYGCIGHGDTLMVWVRYMTSWLALDTDKTGHVMLQPYTIMLIIKTKHVLRENSTYRSNYRSETFSFRGLITEITI